MFIAALFTTANLWKQPDAMQDHWQRPLREGDQEVVRRSARDEPMWVVIHKCMEAMLGISL
jgi:hypothetical protein